MQLEVSSEEKFKMQIENIIQNNKLSHSYLVEIDDDSQMSYIYDFIKMIFCSEKENSFSSLNCGKCSICEQIASLKFPDVFIIKPEGQWIKKEQLINLQNEYKNKSLYSNKRVYVIEQAECLNSASANTILKFLEEPADGIFAILVTKNRYKVLETILSRCQILSLHTTKEELPKISNNIGNLLQCINGGNQLFISYNQLIEKDLPDKKVAIQVFSEIEKIYIYYLNKKSIDKDYIFHEEYEILNKCDSKKVVKYIMIIEEELQKLEFNINYKLWLDNLFSRFVEV